MSNSEIAQLREQIELACEGAKRGLKDFAITANHEMINARMEKLGDLLSGYQQQLADFVGEQEALQMVAETYLEIVG